MAKVSLSLGKKNSRSCEGCTKCCDGWLTAVIAGEPMYPGKPCQFVNKGVGCTIYENRPESLCATFECMWRKTDTVPEKFSPNNSGQILTEQELEGIPYILASYAGLEISPDLLSWLVTFAVGRQLNVEWFIDGESYLLGSPAFIDAKRRQASVIPTSHFNYREEN